MRPTYERLTVHGLSERNGGLYIVLSEFPPEAFYQPEAFYLPPEGLQPGVTARKGDTLEFFRNFPALRGGVTRVLVNGMLLWEQPVSNRRSETWPYPNSIRSAGEDKDG